MGLGVRGHRTPSPLFRGIQYARQIPREYALNGGSEPSNRPKRYQRTLVIAERFLLVRIDFSGAHDRGIEEAYLPNGNHPLLNRSREGPRLSFRVGDLVSDDGIEFD